MVKKGCQKSGRDSQENQKTDDREVREIAHNTEKKLKQYGMYSWVFSADDWRVPSPEAR